MNIVLILPSLGAGGLERVVTKLAWYFYNCPDVDVIIISLVKGDLFYPLPKNIVVYYPSFSIKDLYRPFFLVKLAYWLRRKVKVSGAEALISFGGKFNAFVLFSVYGLSVRTYISDRSRPSISYGYILDWLNPIIYKKATGIIAQTQKAKEVMVKRTNHFNIKVIGNPIELRCLDIDRQAKIILNVGRFISSKRQELLVDYYVKIKPKGWKIYFIGIGPYLNKVKKKVLDQGLENDIIFLGEKKNIEFYLNRSKIFAFTSVSEGFPNALAEAMAAGLACISFDCDAGPSELINDGNNGYLIKENNHEEYIVKLTSLIKNAELRDKFGCNAKKKMEDFSMDIIGDKFLKFIKEDLYENNH